MESIRVLIRDYQQAVEQAVSRLQASFDVTDLLAARRSGKVPKEGRADEIEYSFHGLGCRAILDGIEVDFDFGPGGRTDGFDAWRLWLYTRQVPSNYGSAFRAFEEVRAALEVLIGSGEVECPRRAPSEHLCYWSRIAPMNTCSND